MAKTSKKQLIQSRVFLVGEGKIPKEVLEKIRDDHLKTFLREPDPALWPNEIRHLTQYLPDDEKLKWQIKEILSKHKEVIEETLRKWTLLVEKDLVRAGLDPRAKQGEIIENMLDYLRKTIEDINA